MNEKSIATESVIQLQVKEKSKKVAALDNAVDDLVAVMRELVQIEQQTGRDGLTLRVVFGISETIRRAMQLARSEDPKRRGRRTGPI